MATRADRKREGEVRRVQRDLDRAAQRTANQARQEANSPTLRDPVPYATSQPVNPVGANGLREQRARTATRLSRTEGFTQEQQAAMIGAGNQPADGVGNGQPTMAERYQTASPEERAAMAQSQGIQSVSPESYLIGGTGLVRTGAALGRGIARSVAGSRAPQTAVSALRNPSGKVGTPGPAPRVAGNRSGGMTDDLLGSGRGPRGRSGQGGREATPATGSGRSSVSDKAREVSMDGKPRSTASKPRARVDPDGTLRPAGTPPPGAAATAPGAAAATPGAAAATETAKTLAQRALGLGKTVAKTTATGALLVGAGAGLRSSSPAGESPSDWMQDPDFLAAAARLEAGGGESAGTGRRLGYDPMTESNADRARRELREQNERAGYSITSGSGGRRSRNNVPSQAQSLLRRMEDGEMLTQADFNAAGYDGRGIRVDGDRQGVGAQTFGGNRRADARGGATVDADGYGPAIPVTANSRFEALRNRRLGNTTQDERRAGLRAGQERLALRREAFGDEPTAQEAQRRSLEGGMDRFEAVQRRAGLTEEQRQAEAVAMRDAAAADTASLQAARGLREEARQADQTAAVTDRDSQRRMMSEGLRAQSGQDREGRSGGRSVLGPGGSASPENVRRQADTMAGGIFNDLTASGINAFADEKAVSNAYSSFMQRAGSEQSQGRLPTWVDDSMGQDLFTLTNALAAAETRGNIARVFGNFPDFVEKNLGFRMPLSPSQVRGERGQAELSPHDALKLVMDLMQNDEGGGKWTSAGGTEFRLSDLEGPAARIYGNLTSRIRATMEGQ